MYGLSREDGNERESEPETLRTEPKPTGVFNSLNQKGCNNVVGLVISLSFEGFPKLLCLSFDLKPVRRIAA